MARRRSGGPSGAERSTSLTRTKRRSASGGGTPAERASLYEVAACEALEALGLPVFLLDASGNLLISNQDGQQLLQKDAALAEALSTRR